MAFFTAVMVICGLTLAVAAGEALYGLTLLFSGVTFGLTVPLFVLICGAYALKASRHPDMVRAEWRHPVKLPIFSALSISLLLLETAMLLHATGMAKWLWLIGAALLGVLTLAVISGWVGTMLLAVLVVTLAVLLWRTFRAVRSGAAFQPD